MYKMPKRPSRKLVDYTSICRIVSVDVTLIIRSSPKNQIDQRIALPRLTSGPINETVRLLFDKSDWRIDAQIRIVGGIAENFLRA
jgi:hypothetical protein